MERLTDSKHELSPGSVPRSSSYSRKNLPAARRFITLPRGRVPNTKTSRSKYQSHPYSEIRHEELRTSRVAGATPHIALGLLDLDHLSSVLGHRAAHRRHLYGRGGADVGTIGWQPLTQIPVRFHTFPPIISSHACTCGPPRRSAPRTLASQPAGR